MQSVVVIVVLALALIALLGRAETVLDAELEHSRSAEIENTGEAVDPINNNSNGDGEGEGEGNSYSNGAAVTQAEKMRIYEELSTEIVRIEQLLDSGKPGEAMQLIRVYNSKTGSNTVGDAVSDAVSDTSLEDRVAICLARAYAQTGKYKESELVLKEVLKRNENHITALVTIGKLYYQLQNLNEAQFYFQKVIQLVESDNGSIDSRSSGVEVAYQAYVLLGKLVLVRDSNNAKAKDLLLHANELKPNDERVLFDLGMVLFHNNNHNEAKEMFERAEMINNQMDHKLVGSVYIHFGHLDWASTALEKAVENMKKNLKYSGGNSLSNSYNKNIINKDKFDAELVLLLAECVESLGDRSKALNLYRWVLAIYPENALAHAAIGLMLLGTGNYNYAAVNACGINQEEALSHLKTALALNPTIKPAQDALAFCQKEIAEIKTWRNALRVSGEDDTTYSNYQVKETKSGSKNKDTVSLLLQNNAVACMLQKLRLFVLQKVLYLFQWLNLCKINSTMCDSISTKIAKEFVTPGSERGAKIEAMLKNWNGREAAIQSVSELNFTDIHRFRQEYMLQNIPVKIMNFQDAWDFKIGKKSSVLYSQDALRQAFGENVVRVSVSESGRFDGPENGTLWGLGPNVDVLVRPPATSMLFGDFLTLMQRAGNGRESTVKEVFYLEYLALHQYMGEKMEDMMPLPFDIANSSLKHLVTNLWIGGRPTTSPLHYDDYENFLCQVSGEKEVTLYPPTDMENLYYVGRPKGVLEYEYPSKFTRNSDSIQKKNYVFGSSVHLDAPDLVRHPLFQKARPIRTVLKPGEVLYLPAYWHHEVQSLPYHGLSNRYNSSLSKYDSDTSDRLRQAMDEQLGLNIAVNFWFQNLTYPVDDTKVLNL